MGCSCRADLNFLGEFLFLLDQTIDSDQNNFGSVVS